MIGEKIRLQNNGNYINYCNDNLENQGNIRQADLAYVTRSAIDHPVSLYNNKSLHNRNYYSPAIFYYLIIFPNDRYQCFLVCYNNFHHSYKLIHFGKNIFLKGFHTHYFLNQPLQYLQM